MDIRKVFLGGIVASAVILPATAASASVTQLPIPGTPIPLVPVTPALTTFTGQTSLTNLADYGGRGQWAHDAITRAIKITETGVTGSGGSKVYNYTVVVTDTGTFKTIPNAYTPNQGIPNLGKIIKSVVTGTLTGTADYSFSASVLPTAINSAALTDVTALPDTVAGTGTWLASGFPGGTVFSNVTDGAYDRTYTAKVSNGSSHGRSSGRWTYKNHHWTWVRTFFPVPVYSFGPAKQGSGHGGSSSTQTQAWQASTNNGAGQLPSDGNITGV